MFNVVSPTRGNDHFLNMDKKLYWGWIMPINITVNFCNAPTKSRRPH